jgi:serine/threonine-protein kinase SRPK3
MWNANDDFLPVTPTALRAPELIKPRLWDQKIDIWAVGCLVSLLSPVYVLWSDPRVQIFQLATNEPLFPLASFGCSTDEVHEILQSFMQNLFESGYQKFIIHISERLPTDFGKEETEKLAIFLWSALQECPEDRGSATDLLNHPFLTRTEEVDG